MAFKYLNKSNRDILFTFPHPENVAQFENIPHGDYLVVDELPEHILDYIKRYPNDFLIHDLSKPTNDPNYVVTSANYTPPT